MVADIKSEVYKAVYFLEGTSIYGHGSKFQIWDTTIKLEKIVKAVKHCPLILLSQGNFVFPFFI